MAFGYRFLMVHLPSIEPNSFLLFVHNPAGSTKLRNYASGEAVVLGQPSLARVLAETQTPGSRHECDPHRVDDGGFWYQKTRELNQRHLAGKAAVHKVAPPRQRVVEGRALRGSQRQMQDYVNCHPDRLSAAILEQLPARLGQLGAGIRWVSPLESESYREYRDADFLARVGLSEFAKELAGYWPGHGPCWDALGVISDALGKMKPGVILVEAKSHLKEIYGSGCQASPPSRAKIDAALSSAKSWCGVPETQDWLGPLYQSANRIAHLHFFLERLRTPAWLVNLYFTNDPIGPAGRAEWEDEVARVKTSLGLSAPLPNIVEVYLPALPPTTEA